MLDISVVIFNNKIEL